jgi:hypothetical protein
VLSAIGKSLGESTEFDAEDLPLPPRKSLARIHLQVANLSGFM